MNRRKINRPRLESGFTVVELMTAVFIFGIIVAGVAYFGIYFIKNYAFSLEENQSVSFAQQAITRMIREIREARAGDDGAWTLVQVDDAALTFFSDVTNDGRTDKVRYFLQGSQLRKGVIQPTTVPVTYPAANETISVIADNVSTASSQLFTYYNGEWPADTTNNPLIASQRLLNTRFIQVSVRINIDTNVGSQPFDLSSSVTIRSLKDNL